MTSKFTTPVSWVDVHGDRVFGEFVRWDGDTAICRQSLRGNTRILKSNLTFEGR